MTAIACYCRASTDEQSPDRQLTSTSGYAERESGADVGDLRIYRDKSTETNTNRSGYQDMMADAKAGEFRAVVVAGVLRVCRSTSDLE